MSSSDCFLANPGDLSSLKRIDPQCVRTLADAVNALTPEEIGSRKLVLHIATGGTVAMETHQDGVRLPAYDWRQIWSPIEGLLHNRFLIKGLNAFCLDSSQMDYGHVRELAIVLTYLWQTIRTPHIGFLITHGTDTMSYAAAAMSLIMGQGLQFSIVYTGSQRPIGDLLSDAPLNMRNALCVLEALADHDMAEVLIAFGDRAMLATSAEKVDDSAANAFDAPRHCYVARFNQLNFPLPLASWLKPRRKQRPFAPTLWQGDYAQTLVIKSTLGLNPTTVQRQVEDPFVRAIILYSYGAGTVHDAVLQAVLDTAQKRGLTVFIVNPVNADYRAEYESAAHAIASGAKPLNMTLSAALAKIEIGLRLFPKDKERFCCFVTENYVGEVPTTASSLSVHRSI